MSVNRLLDKTSIKFLTKEEEVAVFANWKNAQKNGDKVLANRYYEDIVLNFRPLAISAARKVTGYGLDFSDVYLEALCALSIAAQTFNIEYGSRFSSYCSRCIILTLYTYTVKNYFMVNPCVSNTNKKIFFNLRSMLRASNLKSNTDYFSHDFLCGIAERLEVDVDTIKEMLMMISNPYVSTNKIISNMDDDLTLESTLQNKDPIGEEITTEKSSQRYRTKLIDTCMKQLDDRTRDIVQGQLLMPEGKKIALEAFSKKYGISRERARQIRCRGIEKLTVFMTEEMKKDKVYIGDMLD